MNNKIAITGIGVLSPFGFGLPSLIDALKNERSAIRNIADTHPEESQIISVAGYFPSTQFVSNIDLLNVDEELKKKFIQLAARAPSTVQASLLVALQAYQQAGLFKTSNAERIGIIIAGNNTTQKQSYLQHQIYAQDAARVSPRYALNFFDSSHIGYVSELLSITGEGHVVGAASASGNMAIIQATRLLEQGILDQCLVIGVYADLSVVELQAFRQIGALGGKKFANQPAKASRPFDKEHEGFIPGQTAACLILERPDIAKKRKAPILGHILGYGLALDAQHSSEANMNGELQAMHNALNNAQLVIKDLDYINAHGTSSVLGDEIEANALDQLLNSYPRKQFVNSTKSLLGHCLFSAGVVEAIATLVQMNGDFIHSNLNLELPINDNLLWVRSPVTGNFKIALSNSFAFGGINTSIIFHKGEALCQ
ncbi:MAG: beta-ketoacyl synthase N-terminal-like domain-containing protein [Gammaproteobacteria bacterium]